MKAVPILASLALSLSLLGCTTTPTTARAGASAVTVTTGGKIEAKNAPITLEKEATQTQGFRVAAPAADFGYTITYVAQVLPVSVGGQVVQANDIAIDGTTAYIAYNVAGAPFAGAIQVVNVSNPAAPAISQEIAFTGRDVNSVFVDSNTLYFAGASDPDTFGTRSFVGSVATAGISADTVTAGIKTLRSYAATSIAKKNDLHVGVGARDGGVERLDGSLAESKFYSYADVRGMARYEDGIVAIAGTTDSSATNARLILVDNNAEKTPTEIPIASQQTDYTKSTIEVINTNTALIGLSGAGFKAIDVKKPDNGYVFELANPTSDTKHATNAVTSDGSLIFVANGEYGFRVVKIKNAAKTGAEFGELVGYHSMSGSTYGGQNYSANFARYANGYLFVASGVGGVNVYRVTANS